ncbi:MAG: choice-of-anchor J domain-containing protein [Bacteroidia bacterium]|nr:choice-of-anchor J domain-containing protein [Bacteroidia bacterium]
MFQLDSVSTDNNVFKQTAGKNINPQVVTLTDIQTVSEAMKGKLIQINDVEFSCNDVGTTYSDAVSFSTVNKTLEDCNGKKVLIRTSGYAKFAGTQVKKGKGSLIGIITVYNTTPQLFIRDLNDVQLSDNDADRCPNNSCNFYLRKNFEDGSVTSNGWTNVNVSGAINWAAATTASQFGTYYCIASNYVGGVNNACETWLVSPAVNLTSSTHPVLNFQSATKYTGPAMEVYVSTDYVNAPINSGSWTRLYPTLSSGNFTWTASGNVDLSMYKSSAVRLAFKYSGTASNGASGELDEIIVKEQ